MRTKSLLIMGLTLAVFLGTAQVVMAEHGGHHDRANDCVKVHGRAGSLGVGYIENTCPYAITVKYTNTGLRDEYKGRVGCVPGKRKKFTCMKFIPANTYQLAAIANYGQGGSLEWIACRPKRASRYSGPWPVEIRWGRFRCLDLEQVPQDQEDEVNEIQRYISTGPAERQRHERVLADRLKRQQQEVAARERTRREAEQRQEQRRLQAEMDRLRWEAEDRARENARYSQPSFLDHLNSLTNTLQQQLENQRPPASINRGRNRELSRDGR